MSTTSSQIKTEVVSVNEIRRQFPALERLHNGYPVAYFDGPGGTQVPRYVVERMNDYLYHHNANTHWAYPTSAETDAAIEHAREVCAEFLNASPAEIAFGANMTTLTYHLSRALGQQYAEGDEIVVTELDHHANVDPWRRLAVERGVTIRTVRMDTATGKLVDEDLERFIGPKTKVVAIGAASNSLGTINDLEKIVAMGHSVGALVFVDAVHYVPHELLDVRKLNCDFVGMSAYKFYGPHVGVMYAKRELLEQIDFPKLQPAPDYAPENAETGTQNQEGMVGAAAAVDFLASLGESSSRRESLVNVYQEMHSRSMRLFERLWNGLSSMPRVTLYGPPPGSPRTATLSFTIEGVASTDAARSLAEKGLFLSHGDFYAETVVKRLGLEPEGLIRAGCACYTTEEEIERLIEGVNELCA
ncbi:MAG TPA: cysteine desulfurase-like protein [Pyrinomonadaceae bacterium]|nr:cysteine desulfurase-like protein [Pyrinomonadaceae bacterium]